MIACNNLTTFHRIYERLFVAGKNPRWAWRNNIYIIYSDKK